MSIPSLELEKVSPSAIIELFTLELKANLHGSAQTYRFHAGINQTVSGNIIWNAAAYTAFPIDVEGFEYNGSGQLPQPRLRVANVTSVITSILLAVNAFNPGNDLIGAKLTRIRTCARYLDAANWTSGTNPYGTPDPTAEFPREIFYIIQKSAETRDVVEFTLGSAFDLQGVRGPKRQCLSNVCSWIYRSAECGYNKTRYYTEANVRTSDSTLDDCNKSLDACKLRFGPIQTSGVVSYGSTTMADVDSAKLTNASVGDYIAGFGVLPNTTITSIGSTSLVMSNAAIATNAGNAGIAGTEVTLSGTLSTSGCVITVASLNQSGISGTPRTVIKGMTVTGPLLPTDQNIIVTNISGSAGNYQLTLSLTYNNNIVGTFRGTRLMTNTGNPNGLNFYFPAGNDIASVVTGDTVTGPAIIGSTTVSNRSGSIVTLSRAPLLSQSLSMSFYGPPTITAQNYVFTSSRDYWIRPLGAGLPYGGFPGVGNFVI